MKTVSFKEKISHLLFSWLNNLAYKQYYRPKFGYITPHRLFFEYLIPQKILRINGKTNWPVHFTSKIIDSHKITKGIMCDPGDSPNTYIQASNGIVFGSNIETGPGTRIISSNHDLNNYSQKVASQPIIIGNNVWIGANTVILPEVHIGNNVVIGAGSVVTKNIPSNCIAFGNPCKVIKSKEAYTLKLDINTFNRTIPKQFDFLCNNYEKNI